MPRKRTYDSPGKRNLDGNFGSTKQVFFRVDEETQAILDQQPNVSKFLRKLIKDAYHKEELLNQIKTQYEKLLESHQRNELGRVMMSKIALIDTKYCTNTEGFHVRYFFSTPDTILEALAYLQFGEGYNCLSYIRTHTPPPNTDSDVSRF